jgi:hypothetical protein
LEAAPAAGRRRVAATAFPDVKVCYIAGAGRSGTTLLDVMLGELDGFFSAGELRWLWFGVLNGWRCGCGSRVRDCPVWSAVLDAAFGAPSPSDIEEVMHLQQHTVRLHLLPRLLAQQPGKPMRWTALASYADVMERLYASIAEVTGARVIVDSSKNAAEAALLRLLPLDPYMVQLARDPRAVANSMKRQVRMEPMADDTFDQPRHSSVVSAAIWMRKNSAAHLTRLRYESKKARLLLYEDVVARPRELLRELAGWLREPFAGVEFVDARTLRFRGNHTAWGNPSRFRTGTVRLRVDDEWVTRLGRADKLVPTALAAPLLARYGYPLSRARSKGSTEPSEAVPSSESPVPVRS